MGLGVEGLLKSGFTKADPTVKKRLLMSVVGREKSGKTHFALTAPAPIVMFGIDIGCEGVVRKFISEKLILDSPDIQVPSVTDYKDDDALCKKAAEEWGKFLSAYDQALRAPEIRTIILDTATEFWDLLRLARFGKLSEVPPSMYQKVNPEFKAVIRKAHDTMKNLILLHHMSPIYIGRNRTDKWERQGFSKTGALVQVEVLLEHLEARPPERPEALHQTKITLCRHDPLLEGTTLQEPIATFPFVAATVMPESKYEEWI